MEKSIRKLCYLSLFCAIAIVLSYIETLFPFYLGIPGAKIGLANVVTLTLLLCFGFKEALIVLLLRIMIVAMAFTNLYMFLYSLAGGILSLFIMFIFNKTNYFHILLFQLWVVYFIILDNYSLLCVSLILLYLFIIYPI